MIVSLMLVDPRWASWNLGIFICIRCSGIHRGMGTHISRVKSVDLDAWTDEQLQSVVRWGNARANTYWESKLAPGHVPSDAKIENFIRTKYESKRWVMDGNIPDPSTLDVGDAAEAPVDVTRKTSVVQPAVSSATGPSNFTRAPQPDLFADDSMSAPRASSTPSVSSRPPPRAEPAPPKQTKPADSLLGLDFFGNNAAAPNRPAIAAATPGTQSRPDLKQSILSLYASAPKAQPTSPSTQSSSNAFKGTSSQQSTAASSGLGDMNDAFSSLSFASTQVAPQQKSSMLSDFGHLAGNQSQPTHASPPPLSGGSFFDTKPATATQHNRGMSSSSGFGSFSGAPVTTKPASSALGDLFDFSAAAPAAQPVAPKVTMISSPPSQPSVFNLASAQSPPPPTQSKPVTDNMAGWSSSDAWGSSDAWSNAKSSPPMAKATPAQASVGDFGGWGNGNSLASQSIVPTGNGGFGSANTAPPKVTADEDFGGWNSSVPAASTNTNAVPKPAGGFGGSDDLFGNVWN